MKITFAEFSNQNQNKIFWKYLDQKQKEAYYRGFNSNTSNQKYKLHESQGVNNDRK